MIVMKFGGTSVGSPDRIRNVYDIVVSQAHRNPIVIVSAVGGITDLLLDSGYKSMKGQVSMEAIRDKHTHVLQGLGLSPLLIDDLHQELQQLLIGIKMIGEISPKTLDLLSSFGERISCHIVAAYFQQCGMTSKAHYAYDVGMLTNTHFQQAEPLPEAYELIHQYLTTVDYIPVLTGFIGKNPSDEITTLGRGGSDYTAAIVGAAVGVEEIQIWTDVDGILTTDPRIVSKAYNVPQVSFKEAAELAYFGAKVLHPKTIRPAMDKQIPVVVKNTGNPEHPGTRILPSSPQSQYTVKAISVKKEVRLINIYSFRMLDAFGFLAKIFRIFEDYEVVVDVVSTSEVSVSVTVDKDQDITLVVEALSTFAQVKVIQDKCIICIVGEGLHQDASIPGRVFGSIADASIPIHMISQGASDINISFVIDQAHAVKAVEVLHSEIFG